MESSDQSEGSPQKSTGVATEKITLEEQESGITDPLLTYQVRFNIRNFTQTDQISSVSSNKFHLAIGNLSGQLIVYQEGNMNAVFSKKIHDKKITKVTITECGQAIITSSLDGKIRIHSLSPDFDHSEITGIKEGEILDFAIRNIFKPTTPEFFVGTQSGKICHYEKGFIFGSKKDIDKSAPDGPIQSVSCFKDIVCWNTNSGLKLYDFKNRHSLGFLKKPNKNPYLNDSLYDNVQRPTLIWKEEDDSTEEQIRASLYYSWYSTIQIVKLKSERIDTDVDGRTRKCALTISQAHQFDFTYIIGITFFGDCLVTLEINYQKDCDTTPRLVIQNEQWDKLNVQKLPFEDQNEFQLQQDCLYEGNFIIHSPLIVLKTSQMTTNDRLTYLKSKQRFVEAFDIMNENINILNDEMIREIQNGYLGQLLDNLEFGQAGGLLPMLLQDSPERWAFWIRKYIELKALHHIISIIPKDKPKLLAGTICTDIFDYFLYSENFEVFLECEKTFPSYLIDTQEFLRKMKKMAIKDTSLKENDQFNQIVYIMCTLNPDNIKGFKILLTLKNTHIFEYIVNNQPEQDISKYMKELLKISADKTIIYFFGLIQQNVRKSIQQNDEQNESDLKRIIESQISKKINAFIKLRVTELDNSDDLEREYLLLFLHAVFVYDKMLIEQYHPMMPSLYLDYDSSQFFYFLKNTDNYDVESILKQCIKRGEIFIKETVHLLDKIGNKKEAIDLLIETMDSIKEAVKYAITSHNQIERDELLDQIIFKCQQTPEKLTTLLNYIEYYKKPNLLITAIPGKTELGVIREALMQSFYQLNKVTQIYNHALSISHNERIREQNNKMKQDKALSSCQMNNICQICHEALLITDIDEEGTNDGRQQKKTKRFRFKQLQAVILGGELAQLVDADPYSAGICPIGLKNPKDFDGGMSLLDFEGNRQTIISYYCGHSFHQVCQLQMTWETKTREHKIMSVPARVENYRSDSVEQCYICAKDNLN